MVVWLVVMPLALLTASMPDSLFDVVSGSDVIVLGRQKRVTEDEAEYEVLKV